MLDSDNLFVCFLYEEYLDLYLELSPASFRHLKRRPFDYCSGILASCAVTEIGRSPRRELGYVS